MVHAGLKCLAPGVSAAVEERDSAPSLEMQLMQRSSVTLPTPLHAPASSIVSLTDAVSPWPMSVKCVLSADGQYGEMAPSSQASSQLWTSSGGREWSIVFSSESRVSGLYAL